MNRSLEGKIKEEREDTSMKYDFTSIMNRSGKDAIAVDGLGKNPGFAPDAPKEGFDIIPMWVADMNFPTVPTIPEVRLLQRYRRVL